jgi:hypothetical protein
MAAMGATVFHGLGGIPAELPGTVVNPEGYSNKK